MACDLSRSLWFDCDARSADLTDSNLSFALLRRVRMRGAKLLRVDLTGAVLDDVDLRGADLTGANMTGVRMRDLNLRGARLDGIRWYGASGNILELDQPYEEDVFEGGSQKLASPLPGQYRYVISERDQQDRTVFCVPSAASVVMLPEDYDLVTVSDLKGADLRTVAFDKSQFLTLHMTHADLRCADLTGATLSDVDLNNADLRLANLSDAQISVADFVSANLSGTRLNRAMLNEVNLSGADLACADLSDASLNKVILAGAQLRTADLSGVVGTEVNLAQASLRCCLMNSCQLEGADLAGADLYLATMRTKASGCSLLRTTSLCLGAWGTSSAVRQAAKPAPPRSTPKASAVISSAQRVQIWRIAVATPAAANRSTIFWRSSSAMRCPHPPLRRS